MAQTSPGPGNNRLSGTVSNSERKQVAQRSVQWLLTLKSHAATRACPLPP